MPKSYRKPASICRFEQTWEDITRVEDVAEFVASFKKEIEEKVSGLDLRLRLATIEDIDAIDQFQRDQFPPDTVTLESPYVLYRIISFGHAILVQNAERAIVGCLTGIYYNDVAKTYYGIRVSVGSSQLGNNLGALMATYGNLLAMQRGARLRRGLNSPVNYPSLFNLLNHVGGIFDGFYSDLPGFGKRFTSCLPLTPAGIKNNRIDPDKVTVFINTHTLHRDYMLISSGDTSGIIRMYDETPFRVVAVLEEGFPDKRFLALPKELLGFPH